MALKKIKSVIRVIAKIISGGSLLSLSISFILTLFGVAIPPMLIIPLPFLCLVCMVLWVVLPKGYKKIIENIQKENLTVEELQAIIDSVSLKYESEKAKTQLDEVETRYNKPF
jgi:membrane protein YdbS with pleckstrin-like domain